MSDTARRTPIRPTPIRPTPFSSMRPVRQRGWMDRFMRRSRPDLAGQSLHNLLARRDPTQISRSDVSELLLHYNVVGDEARVVLVQTWRRVLTDFLRDGVLSDQEIAYLDALRSALALTDAEVAEVESKVIHPRYEIALREALADARLSEEERGALQRLAAQLQLPPAVQRDLYKRTAEQALGRRLHESIADRRLSPEEQEELALLARHLGIEVTPAESTNALLDRFSLLWRIENGDFPTAAAPFALDEGETCYFACPGAWYEAARERATPEGGEGVVSIRIARGVYYRAGSASSDPLNTAPLRRLGTGTLYITSHRLVFDDAAQRRTVALRDVRAFQVHADGLVIEGASTLGPYLTLDGDVELGAVVLGAALARPGWRTLRAAPIIGHILSHLRGQKSNG